ncbi:MAG TPA: tetratricopeptide repeat protein [Pyrinomonadaceae bacterium]
MGSVVHYCQKCLGANPLGAEHCARCGTRLMLVVEPPTARFDAGNFDASHEEHLLERVSALENRLSRLTEKLEQSLTLALKHARKTYLDHTLINTLIAVLGEAGTIDAAAVYALYRQNCEQESGQRDQQARFEPLRREVMNAYHGADAATFGRHIDDAINFLEQSDFERGLRSLERAAASSPTNAPLLAFIGQSYFEACKMTLAKDYLERAFAADPETEGVRLLLGLACGDEGETSRARELLSAAAQRGRSLYAAHYGLGRLLAAEQEWAGALAEFKRALAARPSPEAHYVVGCVYYQLKRDRLATRHLRKAIELDNGYAAAFYMLGLLCLRAGETKRAEEAFAAARAIDASDPRYRAATVRRLTRSGEIPASPPLFYAARQTRKKVLTGGDRRLAEVLRKDALGTFRTREQ